MLIHVWRGIAAPKTTPAEIVGELNKEINAGLADPKLKARLVVLGGTVLPGSPEEFGKRSPTKPRKAVKFSGARAE